VRSKLRVAVAVVLGLVGAPGLAPAEDAAPSRRPARPWRPRPIHDSIERVVDRVVEARLRPCNRATQQGVPCFPVTTEQEGPRFSVAEALRRYRGTGSPAPGVPTAAEIQGQMSGAPRSASGGVGFDPVCSTKNLVRKLSGRNTTFHLYRTWDAGGERPLLTDHLLDPTDYATRTDFHYEYLGQFDGECAAIAAWRRVLRKATEPAPLSDDWDEPKEPPPR
jgi:hypothetical protein